MKVPAIALVALLFVFSAPAHADQAGAKTFIDDLGQRTVEILRQPDLTEDEAVAKFRELFRASFDIPTIGRFVLGRYWRSASEQQQAEYLKLFEDMVIETYARRFTDYSGETFEVTGARPQGERDVLVESRVVRPDGPPVRVGWRVRQRDNGFQIIDVTVEGVSMAITQRNEFASVIQRNGGEVDALLATLRERIASASQG